MIFPFSATTSILIIIISFCIAISPLLIWRNTNRTNRLLALLLKEQNVNKTLISEAYYGSGENIEYLELKPISKAHEMSDNSSTSNSSPTINYGYKKCPVCGKKYSANVTECNICSRKIQN